MSGKTARTICIASVIGLIGVGAIADPVKGKYVKISIPGKKKILSLAEVQVMSDNKNVALKKKATQSSDYYNRGKAELAVDGKTDPVFNNKSVTHTMPGDDPWWMVELDKPVVINEIIITNRKILWERLVGAHVQILDENKKVVSEDTIKDKKAVYKIKPSPKK